MENKKAEAKQRREEQALNRVLLWFGGAVAFELYILMIDRLYVNYGVGGHVQAYRFGQTLFVLGFVFAALTVACAVWRYLFRRAGRPAFVPTVGVFAAAIFCGSTFVALHWYGKGVQLLFVVGITAAVLAMVYYLYQREFFVIAVLAGGGLLCMWLFRIVTNQRVLVYAAFAALGVLSLAVAALARVLQTKKGVLEVGGKKRRVLPKDGAYPMVYAGCAVTAAALMVPLLAGPVAAYYIMFGLVAWLFIMAVYFTVKLM